MGWGLKNTGGRYSPAVPPLPQTEYPSGPENREDLDPSLEEEQTLKESLKEQQASQDNDDTEEEEDEEDG